MRTLVDADYQAVLQFFAVQAAAHLLKHGNLPPAVVLAWLHPEAPQVVDVHQFPTDEVVQLMSTDSGKNQLASAIRQMLENEDPALRSPHVVVQALLSSVEAGEALLLLVHTVHACHAVALPLSSDGQLAVPAVFDLAAARVDVTD